MGRTLRDVAGAFVHPHMNRQRFTDLANASDGVGIFSGFRVEVTSPTSKRVKISLGKAIGLDGKIIRFVNPAPDASTQAQFTAGSSPFSEHDLTTVIAAAVLAGNDTLILQLDWQTESLVVSHDSAANVATNVTTPITADGDAVPLFVRPTTSVTHPETYASVLGVTRFVIATATIAAGVISAVNDANKERRQPFADLIP